MPSVTLTGKWGVILENMRTLIANSAFFRTWTSTADVAAAKARMRLIRDLEVNITRPTALIYWAGDSALVSGAAGPNFGEWPNGQITVRFEDDMDETTYPGDIQNQMLRFIEDVEGNVIKEAITLIQGGQYLQIETITPSESIGVWEGIDGDDRPFFDWEWTFELGGFGA